MAESLPLKVYPCTFIRKFSVYFPKFSHVFTSQNFLISGTLFYTPLAYFCTALSFVDLIYHIYLK